MIVRTMGDRAGKCDACGNLIDPRSAYYWDSHWQVGGCRQNCVRFAIAKAASEKLRNAMRFKSKPGQRKSRADLRMPRLIFRRHGVVVGNSVKST